MNQELEPFLAAQRMSFEVTAEVAATLGPGVTEREAARLLETALVARGVRRWFHTPFVWFGLRSRFDGFTRLRRNFYPTETALAPGTVGILDVGPLLDGHPGDVSYTFQVPGGDPAAVAAFDEAVAALRAVRALIPAWISRGETMKSISSAIDRELDERGYESRHLLYPFGLLGHRITRFADRRDPVVGRFGIRALVQLVGGGLAAHVPGVRARSSLWTADADRPVAPGLWSMEPHLGAAGFGAKFEEMLLVTPDGRARWLDPDRELA